MNEIDDLFHELQGDIADLMSYAAEKNDRQLNTIVDRISHSFSALDDASYSFIFAELTDDSVH